MPAHRSPEFAAAVHWLGLCFGSAGHCFNRSRCAALAERGLELLRGLVVALHREKRAERGSQLVQPG